MDVHDPWGSAEEAREVHLLDPVPEGVYDGVIMAVAHHQFLENPDALKRYLAPGGVLYDVRSVLTRDLVDGRL